MNYAKVILRCYRKISQGISDMDNFIKSRARAGYASTEDAFSYLDKIATIIQNKRLLIILKRKIAMSLAALTREERLILKSDQLNNRPIEGFYYSMRSFYRHRKRAYSHFEDLLRENGLSFNEFMSTYAHIPLIKSVMLRLEFENEHKSLKLAA